MDSFHEFEFVPEFIDISITAEILKLEVGKLLGSAVIGGFDPSALGDLLLSHEQPSCCLQASFARIVEWMAKDFPPWASYRALMACRELALGKDPIRICPVGIGDIFLQAAARCD